MSTVNKNCFSSKFQRRFRLAPSLFVMGWQRAVPEIPKLGINESYTFNSKTLGTRFAVEWISSNGMICDLDLYVLFYDERARFIEKLNIDNPVSSDGSAVLTADIDSTAASASHQEHIHLNFTKVNPSISAIALFVDGGPRNFQFVQSIVVHCLQENIESEGSNFMSKVEPGAYSNQPLFQCINRTRKDFQGVLLNTLYKDGWNEDGTPKWHVTNIFEPVYVATIKEKDEKCNTLIVQIVPTLEKYRPRLFPSVKSICSALTSTALPKLKKKFQKGNGLPIKQFTEVLFYQLYESYPKILEEVEASYTVAMLQDMFQQIDFNGDGTVDWDEFTTFCIHTGLVGNYTDNNTSSGSSSGNNKSNSSSLDEYIIEYCEDNNIKDTTGSSSSCPLAVVRYYKESNRILVVPDKGDQILMFNDLFQFQSSLDPLKLLNNSSEPMEKIKIYDCCYIPSRDFYSYCASDHSITICREQCSYNGKRLHYTLYNRIFSSFLHLKLCYSETIKTLCSVGVNNVIYGWDIDKISSNTPLFQVSRHKDIITDFIAIDRLDLFLTCSLDKRIVMWSMSTRRVKGVLLGHKRGVRCMSYAKGILLTSGFECEARTWDLSLKECTLILKGHRHSIAVAKMMCSENQADDNLRAITVDESCEFRLWNVFVKERGSQCGYAQVLQVFNLSKEEAQIAPIRFLELPFHPMHSKGIYSNIIAASSKLIHFIPEKNAVEFVPPTCMCYSEPNTCIAIGIGRNLFKYDITYGTYLTSFNNIDTSDITCFCFDEDHGRRLYIGCNNGNILLINFSTGIIIDSITAHSKEVSCIVVIKGSNSSSSSIYSGSLDGRIRCMEETGGILNIHNTAEQAIGDNCGISTLKAVNTLKVLVAGSNGRFWGVWNMTTLKRLILIEEESTIGDIEILGSSGDKIDIEEFNSNGLPFEQYHILTLAICTGHGIRIYTIDTLEIRLVISHFLHHSSSVFLSGMTILQSSQKGSVNYSLKQGITNDSRLGDMLVATTDEGYILTWRANKLRIESRANYQKYYRIGHNSVDNSYPPSFLGTPHEDDEKATADHHEITSDLEQVKRNLEGLSFSQSLSTIPFIDSAENSTRSTYDITTTSTAREGIFNLTHGTTTSAIATTTGPLQPMRLYNGLAPKDKRILRNNKLSLLRSASTFQLVTNNEDIRGEDTKIIHHSIRHWRAHNDVIPCIVPLHEHGCFMTTSLDGYNRIWNLDTDCLGELPLPNITEKMKSRGLYYNTSNESITWKFILEKIAVTKSHKDIAERLVQSIIGGGNNTTDKNLEMKRHGVVGQEDMNSLKFLNYFHERPKPIHTLLRTKTGDARDYLRSQVLKELSNKHPTVSDWSQEATPTSSSSMSSLVSHHPTHSSGNKEMTSKRNEILINITEEEKNNIQNTSITARTDIMNESDDSVSSLGSLSVTKNIPITPIHHNKNNSTNTTRKGKKGKLSDTKSSVSSGSMSRSHTSNSIFPSESLWSSTTELNPQQTHAFSETSITMSHHEGLIDAEGHKMLRKINKNPDKVEVYDRLLPEVLLRNPHLTTQVKIPPLDSISDSEVSFGNQKDMYRNANKVFHEKKKFSVQQARHVVTLSRINSHLRHVGSMIHLIPPPQHEIILPNLFIEDDDNNTGQQQHHHHHHTATMISSSASAPLLQQQPLPSSTTTTAPSSITLPTITPLPLSRQQSKRLSNIGFYSINTKSINKEKIANLIEKVNATAETDLPDHISLTNSSTYYKRERDILKRRMQEINEKNSSLSPCALYEKKLITSIKAASRLVDTSATSSSSATPTGTSTSTGTPAATATAASSTSTPTPITLTTRQLLPFYKLADVKHFLDIFQKVDEDYSGDLDPDEWCKFFTSLNKSVTQQQARAIFTRVDTYHHGYLSITDLIPVIFSNANKETQKLILKYVENEISKRKIIGSDLLCENDLEVLFEYYDENNAGFIFISFIKDRIRSFNLSETITYELFEYIKEMEDDEMVNLSEFKRIFKKYITI